MRLNRQVKDLLKLAGARLKRSKKHLVFEAANGRNIVLSHTPSDRNAYKNQVRAIRSTIPFEAEDPKPKIIREKRSKPGRHGEERFRPAPPPNDTLAQQLRLSGAAESILRAEYDKACREYMELQERYFRALQEAHNCWMCRLRKWWKG